MELWKRLRYNENGEPYHPLMYPPLIASFAYGFGFTFFTASWVTTSSLYQAMFAIQSWLPHVWGIAALIAVVLNLVSLVFRHRKYEPPPTFLGVLVWLFALLVYLLGGDYLITVSVTLPNLLFWIWYYFDFKSRR